ncbi:MAG: aminoglycoside 6-adenylyltransferase [Ignavibacteriales bacterium]|nr:aminoglycoside 6-adenylyltransferase [Ignavibacteriales bacterium]
MTIHKDFVKNIIEIVKTDPTIAGLVVGGSWIENNIDEFSDLDLVLITDRLVSDDFNKMYGYAKRFGNLLNAFTGEHVGEKRLLICMYDNPLIHVDIKFIVKEDLKHRVEDPIVLWDRDGSIMKIIETTTSEWSAINFQWIEDRFWTWIHYTATKLGRGELFEALDCLSFLRIHVLSPLLQITCGQKPRGLRKIEQTCRKEDLLKLQETISTYSVESIALSLGKAIEMYQELRRELFKDNIVLRKDTEKRCVDYFYEIKERILTDS